MDKVWRHLNIKRSAMDFRLTDEQVALRETARTFARAELPEIAKTCEANAKPPSRDLIKQYADMGFLGINVPLAYGGPRPW